MPVARRVIARVAAALSVFLAIWLVVVFVQVTEAATSAQSRTADGDAIVVLGAAQYNGTPSPVLERRLDTALELWRDDAAPKIVTTGSNQPGDVFTEGFAAFTYLRNSGVSEDEITVIVDGGDTYESLLATANQLEEGERRVVIVTDAYHARRSAEIATEVGLDAAVVAAGDDTSFRRRAQETVAVAAGRLISYRRLSTLR